MKQIINRGIIEGIVRNSNSEFIDATNQKVNTILSLALEELASRTSYISLNNVFLQPINELMTGAFTDTSSFVYFLAIDNPQIELNTMRREKFWKDWKERIVWAWKNRKPKKKKRRKKEEVKENQIVFKEVRPEEYDIFAVTSDLQNALALSVCETSIIYNEGKRLRIVGKDDFGANTNIIIYPISYDGVFKYFVDRKRGYLDIDNDMRLSKLQDKVENVGENLVSLIKIFNSLYYNFNKVMPNQIFVESLFCNCPDNLFADDIYMSFVNIINYLSMTSIHEYSSIANPEKTIYEDKLCGGMGYSYKKFLTQLLDLKA